MPDACGIFVADPALFCRRRGKFLHQLQAIAQPDFAQDHFVVGIDVLNAGHVRPHAALSVEGRFCRSSSARTASVSAPSTGTFRPSPILPPFHSTGNAGTRNGAPSALKLLTSPPGRSTCGSFKRSSGRLIGEKQIFSASSLADSSAKFQPFITSAT